MFVSSGERQKMEPAQDLNGDLGKVHPADRGGRSRQSAAAAVAAFYTMGHRNPLGLAFAPDGRLWATEMGPQGGDELNLIVRGTQLRLAAWRPTAAITAAATIPDDHARPRIRRAETVVEPVDRAEPG